MATPAAALAITPSIFSPFLDDQGGKIHAKGVSWEGYQRAKLVSAEEVTLLKSLERQASIAQIILTLQLRVLFTTQGSTYAKLYIDLLRKLQKVDTVQAVLVGISNMLVDPATIPLYHQLDDPYGPLIKCLSLQDEFALLESLRLMAVLISTDPKPLGLDARSSLISSLAKLTNTNPSPARDLAVQCLGAILGKRSIRKAVWEHESILSGLVKSLKANPSPQVQYWAIFCFWELSYEDFVAEAVDKRFDLISLLTETAKNSPKEKVTRVSIATLRNLLAIAPTANLPSMLVAKLLPFVNSLSGRRWGDDEIVDDINYLKSELKEKLQDLTTYEEYAAEIESGHLTWSAAHDDDDFWKENGVRMGEESGAKIVKQLVALTTSSRDPLVLAVAAHDIGRFVQYGGDRSRKIVTDLGGKIKVMELLSNESSEVKFQALMAVQRLMSHSWA